LDTTRPLRPWLFGVAFRVVKAHRRRQARETPHDGLEPTDAALDPEGALQSQEALALFTAALQRVPEARRSVLVLHDLESVKVSEIARQLSMTRFGVYSRLRKARKELTSAVRRLLGERERT
jgi:RNA polymerase sigma-70 factor (ECF subfamily)